MNLKKISILLVIIIITFVGCDFGIESTPPETTTQRQERESIISMPETLHGTWYYTYTTNDVSVPTINYENNIFVTFGTTGLESLGGIRNNSFSVSSYTITHYTALGVTETGKINSVQGYMYITKKENDEYIFEGPVSVWANERIIAANGSFKLNQNGTVDFLFKSERENRVLGNLPVQYLTYVRERPW